MRIQSKVENMHVGGVWLEVDANGTVDQVVAPVPRLLWGLWIRRNVTSRPICSRFCHVSVVTFIISATHLITCLLTTYVLFVTV